MIYGIASGVTRVVTGRLCDLNRVNPVYVFQSGMALAGFSVLLFGMPSTYVPLAIISVFYGTGDGVCSSVSNLLLLTTVEPKRRASAFGMANLLISVSIATGAPLAGWSIFCFAFIRLVSYISVGLNVTLKVAKLTAVMVNQGLFT